MELQNENRLRYLEKDELRCNKDVPPTSFSIFFSSVMWDKIKLRFKYLEKSDQPRHPNYFILWMIMDIRNYLRYTKN